jgi:DNA-binding MarR family transcriptional regulator
MAGQLIRRLQQQSTQVFLQRTQAAGFDLTPVQFAALEAIHAHPGADQAQVAQVIACDRATIGGVVDRLEHRGWIRRVVCDRDRRARELSLTDEGLRVRNTLLPVVHALQDDILQPLNETDRDCFLELAQRVVSAWERGRPTVAPAAPCRPIPGGSG